jgi:heme/copper-type cytochrome/quinol oxidase subunit 3
MQNQVVGPEIKRSVKHTTCSITTTTLILSGHQKTTTRNYINSNNKKHARMAGSLQATTSFTYFFMQQTIFKGWSSRTGKPTLSV